MFCDFQKKYRKFRIRTQILMWLIGSIFMWIFVMLIGIFVVVKGSYVNEVLFNFRKVLEPL